MVLHLWEGIGCSFHALSWDFHLYKWTSINENSILCHLHVQFAAMWILLLAVTLPHFSSDNLNISHIEVHSYAKCFWLIDRKFEFKSVIWFKFGYMFPKIKMFVNTLVMANIDKSLRKFTSLDQINLILELKCWGPNCTFFVNFWGNTLGSVPDGMSIIIFEYLKELSHSFKVTIL